jgi:predicted dehydrogenase/threonine dehydrogenase-like Zn-dependent dehydrogenase
MWSLSGKLRRPPPPFDQANAGQGQAGKRARKSGNEGLMRQVLQELSTGVTALSGVPAPGVPAGGLLIATRHSLISAGTERMLVDFGRAGWLEKARQQPDKVRQVWEKVRTDGLLTTLDAVRSKLDQPLPLGYCNVGTVVAVGSGVAGFSVGDRVVSNGPHAEVVAVPKNLCARVPEGVSDEEAVFTVLGAIALQGQRLADPTLGECFAVTGLGLIGLIAVQLLLANGCRVLGIDPDPVKTALARQLGADVVDLASGEDPVAAALAFSRQRGLDGVLITAATKSNEPVAQAAHMCRKRGRIVLVGVVGLELNRADFYEKELSFQVSCSYGPGRYDPVYEQAGHDYPAAFVRWSEQRNFEAVLDMMAAGRLGAKKLITHRFAIGDAPAAYELLASNSEPYLGILLEYPTRDVREIGGRVIDLRERDRTAQEATRVSFIGAGNYGGRVLIPAFAASGARLIGIASNGGVTAAHFGRKFGFVRAVTDPDALFADESGAMVVATRHNSHAQYVQRALRAGKHVFVEKPLAITAGEIDAIQDTWSSVTADSRPLVMVGFNRRFAPHIVRMKELLRGVNEPKSVMITVNAGAIPGSHWTQDPAVGGGRIIGEGCHFIDLIRFLVGHPIADARVQSLHGVSDDNVVITLAFEDGSWGAIHYLANGHRSFPKERVEVFCAGRVLELNNFRQLRGYGWRGFSGMRLWRQDKGQKACAQAFVDAIRTGSKSPIPFDEIVEVARVTVALGEAARA